MKRFLPFVFMLVAMTAGADTLPKMVLTPNGSISTTTWTEGCTVSYNGTAYTNASLEYTSSSQKSIRIKLEKKKALLGSTKFKQWVLLSNSDDATLMRNALADEVSTLVGMEYTPQYQFVDLYIGSTYAGVYQLTDRIKCEAGRACAGDETGVEWLVQMSEEGDVSTSDTYVAGTDAMPYIVMKNPDPDDLTTDQISGYKSDMQTYFTSFFADPKDKIKQDQFVAWYIASEIICNYKGFSETYAYRSNYNCAATTNSQLLRFGPIWDNEKGFGNNASHPLNLDSLLTAESNDGLMIKYADHKLLRKWVKGILESTGDTWFVDAVWSKWQTVKNCEQTLIDKVASLHNTLATTSVSRTADTAAEEALKTYITKRFAYLDNRFAELSGHSSSGIVVYGDDNVNGNDSGNIYSITGQRLSSIPSHGMYIMNGKKMMAK